MRSCSTGFATIQAWSSACSRTAPPPCVGQCFGKSPERLVACSEKPCTGDHRRHSRGVASCHAQCPSRGSTQADARKADGDPHEKAPCAHAPPRKPVLSRRAPSHRALAEMEDRHRSACGAATIGVHVEAGALRLSGQARRAELRSVRRCREPNVETPSARKQPRGLSPCVPRVVAPADRRLRGRKSESSRDAPRDRALGRAGYGRRACNAARGKSERSDDNHDRERAHTVLAG
jgi:hypothetical protein